MWLLIDDMRDHPRTEAVARTVEAGRRLLASGEWECVCFDHDLGEQESGYDILIWAIEQGHLPRHVQLMSANPVGRRNMRAALEADGYITRDNGINFYKSIVKRSS